MEASPRPTFVPTTLRATRGAVALALAIGLAITTVVAWDVYQGIHKEARLHFESYGDRLADAMATRVHGIETGLRGARAMIAAHGGVDRLRFRRFVVARDLSVEFPGVRNFAFVERVRREDLPAFIARERADHAPGFAVRTKGEAPDLLIVKYVEPVNAVVGFDIGQDPRRRAAAEQAIASGQPALTAPLMLARDGNPGWLMFLPVYRGGTVPAKPADRQELLMGLILAPIAAGEVLSPLKVFGAGQVEFQLIDGGVGVGSVLFDSRVRPGQEAPVPAVNPRHRPKFDEARALVMGDRAFTLRITSTPRMDESVPEQAPALVALGGTALSLLVAMAIRRLMQRREQALAEAAEASADLRRVAGGLAERERLIRLITDSMPARLSYWDRDLRCRLANRTLAAVVGRTPEQMIGMKLQEMLPPDRFEISVRHAEAALRGEPRQFESNALTVNGRRTSAIVYYVPDRAGDEVPGFFAFALDITELKDAQEEAQRASAAKSQFLSNMSHEIRTPMNAVLGMLALLRMTSLDGRQSDYATKAEAAARSLLSLLNDVLDFSKIEAGKMTLDPRPFSFRTLLDDLQVILAATVGEKPTALRFTLDPALPAAVIGDDMRLRQILINLGGNAIKFTQRGEVAVEVAQVAREGEEVEVVIAVSDTGIGISPQDQQRIFVDFSQAQASTTRDFGGTGLGLAICSRLATLMGARLQVQSALGQGSRFHFRLRLPVARTVVQPVPSDPLRPVVEAPPGQVPAERPLRGTRVLVVEDNPINQQVARELLVAAGADVQLAVNGREAVLTVAAESFDAVLMDVQMPVMDGYQATRDIRQKLRQTELPIIAMTANAMDSDREQCRAAGMDDHVGKPFVPADLVATILRHVKRAAQGTAPASAPAPAPAPAPPAAAASEPAPAEPIDRAAALAFLGGDEALYRSLLPTFCADLRETLRKMASLPDGLPRSDATRLLHSLKSTAATFGARQLAAAAAAAEHQSKDPATVLDERVLAPVSEAIQRTLAVLEPATQG